ncbi:uncharacterized protein LOC135849650 isoform X1 [Planococcus citri]|uniref:uncharacterized protein LOC135849650 isoform X1 n=1 Tax=Planococcus citri TaxID=170843 RepID=UPI0031F994DF
MIMKKFPFDIIMKADLDVASNDLSELRQKVGELIWKQEQYCGTNWSESSDNNPNKKDFFKGTTESLITGDRKPSKKCIYCVETSHYSDECSKITTLEDRRKKLNGRCIICLNPGHLAKDCTVNKPCVHCKKRRSHHRSLCIKLFSKEVSNPEPTESLLMKDQEGNLLAATVNVGNESRVQKVTSILDSGSRRSYITTRLADKLKLKPLHYETIRISTICSEAPREISTKVVSLDIFTNDGEKIKITANTIPKIINRINHHDIKLDSRFKKFKLAEVDKNLVPELLIGNDYMFDFMVMEKVIIDDSTSLINSKFGWLVVGRIDKNHETPVFFSEIEMVENLWKLDAIGIDDSTSVEDIGDELAVKSFYDNIELIDNRYEVAWPWKEYPPDLKSNKGLAYGRLKSQMRKFEKNKELFDEYDKVIKYQESQGIIERVNESINDKEDLVHYLPHHEVLTPGKSTSLRVVYDGSAKSRKIDKSLNDCIFRGRVLLETLCGLILRLMLRCFVLTSDIEKAFLQIGLKLRDRDFVRFIWIKDFNKPLNFDNLIIFRFTKIPFGVIASPFLLTLTIIFHLNQYDSKFVPLLLRSFYVDNLILSVDSVDEAIDLYNFSKSCFNDASMNLRNWVTNCNELKNVLKPEDRLDVSEISILGLKWNVKNDTFVINHKLTNSTIIITKREVVKKVSSIFDPLGFLCPVVLPAKLFIRYLWGKNLDWDDVLDEKDQKSWKELLDNLKCISNVEIDRYVFRGTNACNDFDLHCFVDASQKAYAATVYVKKNNLTRLVFAKSRLAPRNNLTIPKLELLAIYIGSQIVNFVKNEFSDVNIKNIYVWSDSKCVLSWLCSKKVLPKFVERIVKKIDKSFNCRYVPSAENPADIASRGAEVQDLNSFWWEGPTWLKEMEVAWPKAMNLQFESEPEPEPEPVLISNNTAVIQPPFKIDCTQFKTLNYLLDATLSYMKNVNPNNIVQKTEEAFNQWIMYIQNKNYPDISQPNPLGLKRDSQNIIRCHGRLVESCLNDNAKFPILLPEKEYFTHLLIEKIHIDNYHVGVSHTLSELRKNFWIPKGRSTVYYVLKKCANCKYYDGGPYKYPAIPPLPEFRVNQSSPFSCCGIDTFGPLYVSDNSVQKKVFVSIFVCMITRAIHLELLENMTTQEFLLAFRNFIALRTIPKFVISDNAPQFKITKSAFENLWQQIISDNDVIDFCKNNLIEWKLLPEYAPWHGGFYERLIGIVKMSLKKTIFNCIITENQLRTVLYEVTSVINSRSIVYVGENDSNVLTPNDLMNTKFDFIPDRRILIMLKILNVM